MDINNLLNPDKQHQVLLSILGWLPGHDALFITALKDGCTLQSTTAYLACLKGWGDLCLAAKRVTREAVKELMEKSDKQAFFEACINGYTCKTTDGDIELEPNFLMAYYIDPEKTLEHMKDHNLWLDMMALSTNLTDLDDVKLVGSFLEQHDKHPCM